MAGSLPLKNDVQPVTQLPQSQRQVHDVLSAVESVPPISYTPESHEVPCQDRQHPVAVQRHRRTRRTSAAAAAAAATYCSVVFANRGFAETKTVLYNRAAKML